MPQAARLNGLPVACADAKGEHVSTSAEPAPTVPLRDSQCEHMGMPREAQGVPDPQEVHQVLEHVESTHDPDDKSAFRARFRMRAHSTKLLKLKRSLFF